MDTKAAVNKVWEDYLKAIGENIENTNKRFTSWSFGNSEDMANKLLELVLMGKKKATASSLWVFEHDHEPIPKTGDYSIITNWDGFPKAIIMTTNIEITPFIKVTEEFAVEEGEGDLSLNFWREAHTYFFKSECNRIGKEFIESMPVVCEKFELVYKV